MVWRTVWLFSKPAHVQLLLCLTGHYPVIAFIMPSILLNWLNKLVVLFISHKLKRKITTFCSLNCLQQHTYLDPNARPCTAKLEKHTAKLLLAKTRGRLHAMTEMQHLQASVKTHKHGWISFTEGGGRSNKRCERQENKGGNKTFSGFNSVLLKGERMRITATLQSSWVRPRIVFYCPFPSLRSHYHLVFQSVSLV